MRKNNVLFNNFGELQVIKRNATGSYASDNLYHLVFHLRISDYLERVREVVCSIKDVILWCMSFRMIPFYFVLTIKNKEDFTLFF